MIKRYSIAVGFLFFSLTNLLAYDEKDSLYTAKKDSTFFINTDHAVDFFIEEQSDVLTEGVTFSSDLTDSLKYFIGQGRAAIDKVKELGNYITSIDEATQFQLPVGLSKAIPGLTWDLVIHAIRLKPTHAELDIF